MSSPIKLPMDWLRGLADAFLPDLADVSRYTETNTADGPTQDWQTVATGIPCRISPAGIAANEQVEASAQIVAANRWTVWLPAETDLTVLDRIVSNGRTFEVQRVTARSYETTREIVCRELT
jgi:head-tail adaptor